MSTISRMRDETKLFLTSKSRESLRTTVPMSIVKQLDLRENDYLGWQLKYDESTNELIIEARAIKKV